MRTFNEIRPENIKCDNIWKLYMVLVTLDSPYLKTRLRGDDTDYLYLIKSVSLESGEVDYTFDQMCNMELPYRKNETIHLCLKRMLCNEEISKELDISVNSYSAYDRKLIAKGILDRHNVALPNKNELNKSSFVRDMPVTYIEEKPKHKTGRPHKGWRLTNQERAARFKAFLDDKDIWYMCDTDLGVPHITMVFEIPDCLVGCIESSIWFFERHAEVKTYYPEVVSKMCECGCLDELLKLLNYMNAYVIPGNSEGEVNLSPRFYNNPADFSIVERTVINYKFWDALPDTEEYITGCCPELLNDLAPFIVGVITGNLTSGKAMELIETNILN